MRFAFCFFVILLRNLALVWADGDVMEFVKKTADVKWIDVGTDKVYYFYNNKQITWHHAVWVCRYLGLKRAGHEGRLASFKSETELNLLHKHIEDMDTLLWIGQWKNAEGSFKWMDHSIPNYTNWDEYEPNNAEGIEDCVALRTENLSWKVVSCYRRLGFICASEKDILPNKPDKLQDCEPELKGWKLFNGNCYLVRASHEDALDWISAEQYCVDRDAHLISVLDQTEEDYVFSKLLGESESLHSLWSGRKFYGEAGNSNWTDGSSTSFGIIRDKTYKSGCLSLNLLHGRQQVLPCNEKIGSICKMAKPLDFESALDPIGPDCLLKDDPQPEANKGTATGGNDVAGVACDIAIRLITLLIFVYMLAKLLPSYNTLSTWAQDRGTWKQEKRENDSAERISLPSNAF